MTEKEMRAKYPEMFAEMDSYNEKQDSKELQVQTQIEWHIARFGYVTGSEVHRISFIEAKKAEGTSRAAKLDWLKNNANEAYNELLGIAKKQGKDVEKLPTTIINKHYDSIPAKLVPSEKTINYAHELAGQMLLDINQLRESETIPRWLETSSTPTEWGKENEPLAREAVADLGYEVETPPQIQHKELSFVRYNADGILTDSKGSKGLLEIKCPYNPNIHTQNLLSNKVLDKKHIAQICLGMIVTGADFYVFASYDPRTIKAAQLGTVFVKRSDFVKQIWQMELNLRMFWADVYRPILKTYVKKGLLLDCPFLV